eukprot:Selendium_serpulae@DN6153_c0_g1_i2.p1
MQMDPRMANLRPITPPDPTETSPTIQAQPTEPAAADDPVQKVQAQPFTVVNQPSPIQKKPSYIQPGPIQPGPVYQPNYGHQQPYQGYSPPPHYGHPPPSPYSTAPPPKKYDQKKKLKPKKHKPHNACCLEFPDAHQGPLYPLFDTLLFVQECPTTLTGAVVCEEATKLYTKHRGIDQHSILAFSGETEGPFPHDKLTASHSADLALVNSGGCYNVYPNVKKGDHLSSDCTNSILGDIDSSSLANDVLDNNVYAAGDVCIFAGSQSGVVTLFTMEASVYIGGDWTCIIDAVAIATVETTGPYPDTGLLVAGDILGDGTTTDIDVQNGMVLLGGSDVDDRAPTKVRLQDPEAARMMIQTQVCGLSMRIAMLDSNSNIMFAAITPRRLEAAPRRRLVINDPNSIDATFECSAGAGQVCVFELSADQLNNFNSITFSATDAKAIKINVHGNFVNLAPETITDSSPDVPIVWNFISAESITISNSNNAAGTLLWAGAILAPVATDVNIFTEVDGAIAVGNPNSVTTIGNDNVLTTTMTFPVPRAPMCDAPDPSVTYCHCLCPEPKLHDKKALHKGGFGDRGYGDGHRLFHH